MVDNGTFILPVMWFSCSKLSSEIKIDLFIFRGSTKQYWRQNFVYLTQNSKITYIMIPLFYLIQQTWPHWVVVLGQIWPHHSYCLVERGLFRKFEKIAWKTKKWYPKNLNSHPIWNTMPSHVILWTFIVYLRLTHHSAMFFTKLCLFNAYTGKMTSMCAQGCFVQRLYHLIDTLR